MVQGHSLECLPRMCEVLHSIASATGKKKGAEEGIKEEEEERKEQK